jgi:hypothetical protein
LVLTSAGILVLRWRPISSSLPLSFTLGKGWLSSWLNSFTVGWPSQRTLLLLMDLPYSRIRRVEPSRDGRITHIEYIDSAPSAQSSHAQQSHLSLSLLSRGGINGPPPRVLDLPVTLSPPMLAFIRLQLAANPTAPFTLSL